MKRNTKKTQPKQKKILLNQRRALFGALILLIAAGAIYVLSGWAYQAFYVQPREARINAIYASLEIDPTLYREERRDIFGEKKVYDYDKSRSYSSSIEYLRGAAVGDTVRELDEKIKAAGFDFIDEPYPGTRASTQYHYKSAKNEYIRLTVQSKPFWDYSVNRLLMGESISGLDQLDPNAGPSMVTIKVNLDDNNE